MMSARSFSTVRGVSPSRSAISLKISPLAQVPLPFATDRLAENRPKKSRPTRFENFSDLLPSR
jgi:predicted component of type VI protein secretion system